VWCSHWTLSAAWLIVAKTRLPYGRLTWLLILFFELGSDLKWGLGRDDKFGHLGEQTQSEYQSKTRGQSSPRYVQLNPNPENC